MGEISEKAFPFDSEPDNLGNNDREYFANDFTRYFKEFISSGLFMKRADSLQVIANGDMTVTLRPGNLIIDGYRYENLNDIIIPIEPADGVLNRIDRVSVTWIKEERDIHKTVQKGTQSYLPVAPECRRTEEYKDYVVADIYIPAGSIKITQDNITDQRLNSEICGLAIAFSEIDTKLIFDQLQAFYEKVVEENRAWEEGKKQEFDEWFQNAKNQLAGDVAGNLQKQIGTLADLLTENKENLVGAVNEVKESIRAPVTHLLATEEGSPLDATMGNALKGEIDEVKEDINTLNGKLGMYPDYENAIIPFSHNITTNTEYITEIDGILFLCLTSVTPAGIATAKINDVVVANHRNGSASNNLPIPAVYNIPVRKGTVIKISASSYTYVTTSTRLIPYK